MDFRNRLARPLLIAVTAAGFAAGTGTAVAAPSDQGAGNRSDNAVQAQTDHKPAGDGQGRKVG
ncbi:MAG: hypothetical protein QOE28_653 [Solirubrobacteraceae bacterium]|jgi:hypothetical protein|nr:hypothetical protein [Solirubrobacteraceae bacterium]